jgi:hypothetical protein
MVFFSNPSGQCLLVPSKWAIPVHCTINQILNIWLIVPMWCDPPLLMTQYPRLLISAMVMLNSTPNVMSFRILACMSLELTTCTDKKVAYRSKYSRAFEKWRQQFLAISSKVLDISTVTTSSNNLDRISTTVCKGGHDPKYYILGSLYVSPWSSYICFLCKVERVGR